MGWSADADRRFSASSLGKKVAALLQQGSASQRQISEFVLRDPVFIATHGIEDVARSTGISPSTISRYVRDLGLSSYASSALASAKTVHALIAPIAKLGARLSAPDPERGAAEASLAAAMLNIQSLSDPSSAVAVRAVAHRVKDARHVW